MEQEREQTIAAYSAMSERKLVKTMYLALRQRRDLLKVVHKHVNLENRRFQEVWSTWWRAKLPPRLEIDLIVTFEDLYREIDDALIVGVEVKYFRVNKSGKMNMNFYEGLEQTFAYALFGFDGLALWHIFHPDTHDDVIRSYTDGMMRIIHGFRLPIFYLAGRLAQEHGKIRLEQFAPSYSRMAMDLGYIARWMHQYFSDTEMRNPLQHDPGLKASVREGRSTLKAVLRIPV